MSQKLNSAIAMIGIDIGKNSSPPGGPRQGRHESISVVGNPNMVRNEKDFEMIIIAQGQKQDVARVAFAPIPKIGALLFDKRKL